MGKPGVEFEEVVIVTKMNERCLGSWPIPKKPSYECRIGKYDKDCPPYAD